MPEEFITNVETHVYDKEVLADLLTELLFLALTGPKAIQGALIDLCEGICDVLDEDTIARCKDYSRYRKNEYAKTLE